jgi:hypothetical protein
VRQSLSSDSFFKLICREKTGTASPKKPLRTKKPVGAGQEQEQGVKGRSQSMREISSAPSLGTSKGPGDAEIKVGISTYLNKYFPFKPI